MTNSHPETERIIIIAHDWLTQSTKQSQFLSLVRLRIGRYGLRAFLRIEDRVLTSEPERQVILWTE